MKLFITTILISINIISCKNLLEPQQIHKMVYTTNSNIPYDSIHIEEVWETNYQIHYTYSTNEKDNIIPKLKTVALSSEYGYFGATKSGNTFTIPVYSEEYYNFSSSHVQLFSDIMTSRAAINYNNSISGNKKHLSITLLGGNIQTNRYEVYIEHQPNTTAEYKKWKQLACEGQQVKTLWFGHIPNGQFQNYGETLLLSRTGNGKNFQNNSYPYSLVRVVDSGNSCIYKNKDTGSFICVKIKYDGGVKKVYLVKPHNGEFIVQGETPYDAALANSILSILSFSKSFLWARTELMGIVGFTSDLIDLIFRGSYMYNNYLSIQEITGSGYLVKNYDWDKLLYWGDYRW